MKITRRQIRQIIRETVDMAMPAKEVMTPDYVLGALTKEKSARTGVPFITIAMDGINSGDFRASASAIMDALWIDDIPDAADKELEGLLADARTEDDVAAIGAEWGTRHFRSN